jgi:hypothetical protein
MKMFLMMLMEMMTEGVEAHGGNFGSVSPLRTPPTANFFLSVYLFSIPVFVCHEKDTQMYM